MSTTVKVYIFIILAISMIGVLSAELKEFDINTMEQPEGSTAITEHPDLACIIINSSIIGLKFDSNMAGIEVVNEKPEEARYYLFIKPNYKQIITVKSAGYLEEFISISNGLGAGETIFFTIEPKSAALNIDKGSLRIITTPSGADIRIDGIPNFHEKTPFTMTDFTLMAYRIMLSKPGYENIEMTIQLEKDKQLTKMVDLKPIWKGRINISCNIPNTLFTVVDSVDKNTVTGNLTQINNTDFVGGRYRISADATPEGFSILEQTVEINASCTSFSFQFSDREREIFQESQHQEHLRIANKIYPNSGFNSSILGTVLKTGSTPLYTFMYNNRPAVQIPIIFETMLSKNSEDDLLKNFIIDHGWSSVGYVVISHDFAFYDLVSINSTILLQTNDLKNRIFLGTSVGLKMFYETAKSHFNNQDIMRGNPSNWDNKNVFEHDFLEGAFRPSSNISIALADCNLTLERYISSTMLLSLRYGFVLVGPNTYKWYYKSDIDTWLSNPESVKPSAINADISFTDKVRKGNAYGVCPFFGIGLRF